MEQENFFRLSNRVAVVTGGGQGIGEGIAARLHAAGAKVAILDLNGEAAISVAKSIEGIGVECDVSSAPAVQSALDRVRKELGPIDIVVNNAGITGRTARIWELEEEDMDRVYTADLKTVFLMCRAVMPEMLARRYGRIVNMGSISGKEGNPTMGPYSSCKAAVICLTKVLAKEVAGQGDITVNSIAPGVVRTKILDGMAPATVQYMISKIPMGRTARIDEVAALVHFLVSSEASFTTGQCYDISGGRATY